MNVTPGVCLEYLPRTETSSTSPTTSDQPINPQTHYTITYSTSPLKNIMLHKHTKNKASAYNTHIIQTYTVLPTYQQPIPLSPVTWPSRQLTTTSHSHQSASRDWIPTTQLRNDVDPSRLLNLPFWEGSIAVANLLFFVGVCNSLNRPRSACILFTVY